MVIILPKYVLFNSKGGGGGGEVDLPIYFRSFDFELAVGQLGLLICQFFGWFPKFQTPKYGHRKLEFP